MKRLRVQPKVTPGTLGAVLYAGASTIPVPEEDWVALVRSIARSNLRSLHELYERTKRPVYTLIARIVGERPFAEELTLAVFYDVWLHASRYTPRKGPVLAWIMNLARAKAIGRLRVDPAFGRTASRALAPHTEPGDLLEPSESLQERLARRVSTNRRRKAKVPAMPQWREPAWENVAPGISCKLLASDDRKHLVSMLVRLTAGGEYPPHTHAGVEELHLLHGELWIDGMRLSPGDYNRAEPGTADQRVWSKTGCTCVLITSTDDILLQTPTPSPEEPLLHPTNAPLRRSATRRAATHAEKPKVRAG